MHFEQNMKNMEADEIYATTNDKMSQNYVLFESLGPTTACAEVSPGTLRPCECSNEVYKQ